MDPTVRLLQDLYNSEINYTIATFWDAGFRVLLGDDLNGFVAEMRVPTFGAAAKAWREYREQQRREEDRAADIAADLAQLDRLRRYLITGRRAHWADAEKLRGAIDDYVEQLTGDRTKLHARSSSIG